MAFSANDLMALVRAGFTASQIAAIGQELSTPSTEASTPSTESTESTPSTESTESAESASPTVTAPVLSETPPPTQPAPQPPAYVAMGDIMAKLDALTNAVKAGAVRNDQQPGGGAKSWTSEDIMAQIINPTYKKEG